MDFIRLKKLSYSQHKIMVGHVEISPSRIVTHKCDDIPMSQEEKNLFNAYAAVVDTLRSLIRQANEIQAHCEAIVIPRENLRLPIQTSLRKLVTSADTGTICQIWRWIDGASFCISNRMMVQRGSQVCDIMELMSKEEGKWQERTDEVNKVNVVEFCSTYKDWVQRTVKLILHNKRFIEVSKTPRRDIYNAKKRSLRLLDKLEQMFGP